MNNSDFKTKEYWNSRFKKEVEYDWLMTYNDVKESLVNKFAQSDRILIVGCGNSTFSEDLYSDGYMNIVNIDFSEVCIEKMKERCKDCTNMTWQVMNMKTLDFPADSFDVVIDKAAIDALMTSEKSAWTVSQECREEVDEVLSEISRVLRPNGTFLSLTFVSPILRKVLYANEKYDWSIQITTVESTRLFSCYLYTMKIGESLSAADIELAHNRFKVQENVKTLLLPNEQDNEEFLLNIDSDIST
ncbi:EEF1A lysine methyltransferase 4-like [Antedon mediterranea]|uniref:EEF1A lysine methyltransferase 4-like n=1 Tax=Antedon mediterranea TaxID=105859 RepID=UPI003AF86A79